LCFNNTFISIKFSFYSSYLGFKINDT
jgi:hypothetical protein